MRARTTIAGLLLIALVVAVGVLAVRRFGPRPTRSGLTLKRLSPEAIRLSWGTPSGVTISAGSTLEHAGRHWGLDESHARLPSLAPWEGVWMFPLDESDRFGVNLSTSVNPLLRDAEGRIDDILLLPRSGDGASERATRRMSQSFVYLGWAVLDEQDARALSRAPRKRLTTADALEQDGRTLHRLRRGVERRLAKPDADESELERLRRTIPVFFECMNTAAGHPREEMSVLYLDGHLETLRWGERFPAVQAFVDAFPPPPDDYLGE